HSARWGFVYRVSLLLEVFDETHQHPQEPALFRRELLLAFAHQTVNDLKCPFILRFSFDRFGQGRCQQLCIFSCCSLSSFSNCSHLSISPGRIRSASVRIESIRSDLRSKFW